MEKNSSYRDKLSIVVTTCAAYEDIAILFERIILNIWDSLIFDIYLVTDKDPKHAFNEKIKVIVINNNSWKERLMKALEKIDTKYIMFMMEDYFIRNPLKSNYFYKVIDFMDENSTLYYKLVNVPFIKSKDTVARIPSDLPFGVNLQSAIWNKQEMISILAECDDSPWDFEKKQLEKSYYGLSIKIPYYVVDLSKELVIDNAVIKGKWVKSIYKKYTKKYGYLDSKRSFLNIREVLFIKLKRLTRTVLPKKSIYHIKKYLSYIGIKFTTKY